MTQASLLNRICRTGCLKRTAERKCFLNCKGAQVTDMVKRCVLGCYPFKTLFPFPKQPWLRTRWLEFLHFEEGGITESSRLCARHFAKQCFTNLQQYEMGFADFLNVIDTAIPTIYTVAPPSSVKPVTKEVGCQCDAPIMKSVGVQADYVPKRPKRRSKGNPVFTCIVCFFNRLTIFLLFILAIQVRPSASVSCSDEEFPVKSEASSTLTPIKRPRVEDSSDGSSCCSEDPPDDTQVPDIIPEEDIKLEPCDSSYIVVTL
nr:uncharacterized protein LOC563780 isoform X2 [Danio rerio]XP_021335462.1 uncharacterized protein LOC563780 isoform X2 [Danio rerio]|eukprot:XP_021328145.1 uncharacterized protein LOC563780 isoform X2 [Danio rerio]